MTKEELKAFRSSSSDAKKKKIEELRETELAWANAMHCPHCEGTGYDRVKYEANRVKYDALLDLLAQLSEGISEVPGLIVTPEDFEKYPSWDDMTKAEKLDRAYELNCITQKEKELACGSVGIFNAKVAAHVLNNDPGLWAGVKKALGRSFVAVVDEEKGNVVLKVADEIHDGPCWYTHDVALLTREDDETVERWCQSKFIAGQVRRGEEPIPFGKQGKTTTFNRDEVIAWWARKQAPVNPQVAAVAAARNGKRKR